MLLESFPEERFGDCEDSLENQREDHEKHPMQELVPQKRLSLARRYQCGEFRRDFSQCSVLVQHQGGRVYNRGSRKNFRDSDMIKQGYACAGKKSWKWSECEKAFSYCSAFVLH